jgi:hypothetical protein
MKGLENNISPNTTQPETLQTWISESDAQRSGLCVNILMMPSLKDIDANTRQNKGSTLD